MVKWCDRCYNAYWYRDGISSVITWLDQFKGRCFLGCVEFKIIVSFRRYDLEILTHDANTIIPDIWQCAVLPLTSDGVHLKQMTKTNFQAIRAQSIVPMMMYDMIPWRYSEGFCGIHCLIPSTSIHKIKVEESGVPSRVSLCCLA